MSEANPVKVNVPEFAEDSAYAYIQKQLAFGPRVPNTPYHDSCAVWIESKLKEFAEEVIIQKGTVTAFDGTELRIQNIIAVFNHDAKKRILLCAHWDTRPWADEDTEDQDKPIPGANDGGSGVGVLMEVARQLSLNPLGIGVDIIFFDAEDYGKSNLDDSYCLGSQFWAKKNHKANYNAQFGILLDMVGAKNAKFYMEGHSMKHASSVVRKVWNAAARNGYSNHFIFEKDHELTDDHVYVNQTGIPCIDIIQRDIQAFPPSFGSYWHTHKDNIDIIDKNTLKAVGQTVLTVLYEEDTKDSS